MAEGMAPLVNGCGYEGLVVNDEASIYDAGRAAAAAEKSWTIIGDDRRRWPRLLDRRLLAYAGALR